jgi:hypothetical protein
LSALATAVRLAAARQVFDSRRVIADASEDFRVNVERDIDLPASHGRGERVADDRK